MTLPLNLPPPNFFYPNLPPPTCFSSQPPTSHIVLTLTSHIQLILFTLGSNEDQCPINRQNLKKMAKMRCTVFTKANVITAESADGEVWNHCWCPSGGKLFIMVLDFALCRAVERRKEELGCALPQRSPDRPGFCWCCKKGPRTADAVRRGVLFCRP